MNSENDKNMHYEDEINLYEFWKNIMKRKKIIFLIVIISIISAGILCFMMPKIYRGEVAVRIQPKESISPGEFALKIQPKELMSPKELFEIIGKFDREKIERIFPQNFDFIKSVRIIQIAGSADKFKIIVELSQTTYFQEVIKIFVEYLNNIPLIARAVEQSREILTKRLEEIDVVMSKSQEDAERFQRMMVKEKLNPIGFNPVQFNRMLSDVEIEKLAVKQSIKNLTGFEIVTNPVIFQSPVRPRPILYLIFSGIFGLFAGLFTGIFMNFLERVREKKV
jgi:hypothetical protein